MKKLIHFYTDVSIFEFFIINIGRDIIIVIFWAGTVGEVAGVVENHRKIENLQTTALLKSEYSEKSWRPKETCHSDFSERPSVNANEKKLQGVK